MAISVKIHAKTKMTAMGTIPVVPKDNEFVIQAGSVYQTAEFGIITPQQTAQHRAVIPSVNWNQRNARATILSASNLNVAVRAITTEQIVRYSVKTEMIVLDTITATKMETGFVMTDG